MKKLITLVSIALMAAACTNNDAPTQEYGQINLALANSANPEIDVNTRTVTDLTEADAANYNIAVYQTGKTMLEPTNYITFKNTTTIFPVGSNYTVTAESCTEDDAKTANNNTGQARYFGTSDVFEINTNQVSDVTVTCSMANAKVSITYDEVFAKVFSGYTVAIYTEADESRKVTFDSNAKIQYGESIYDAAFFNVDSNNKNLKCTVTGSYKGNVRTATQTITLEAAKHYKINIKTSASGQIGVALKVDDTVTDVDQNVEVNPYL